MPVQISKPDRRTIKLIDVGLPQHEDPKGEAYVVVRQATQRDVQERASLTADATRIFTDEGIKVQQKWNPEEQKALEVYLTLEECNLELEDEYTPGIFRPAFTFVKRQGVFRPSSWDEFLSGWGQLPETFADAIHEAVLTINPQWDPKSRRP